MKSSSLPRVGAFALALAFGLTGCGLFTVQDGVAAKAVKVDLVFGAQQPSQPPEFSDPLDPFDDALPPLPPPPILPPPPPNTETDICPPTSASGARDETVTTIQRSHEPQGNEYLTAFKSQIEGAKPKADTHLRTISGVEQEPSPFSQEEGRRGFQYFVKDAFSGVQMQFLVLSGTDDEQGEEAGEGGLYLKTLVIPTKDQKQEMFFITPSYPYLKLMDFPITQGTELTTEAPDVAAKRRTIDDPVTGEPIVEVPTGAIVPSANSLTAETKIGDIDNKVQVCADLGASYRVTLDLKVAGDFNHRLIGTFWLAPQYGGWPIKDDYFMFGDLLEGVFSNNIMELPPAQCEDKLDNDGDGKVDFASTAPDPQCSGPKDNDETI